jgi:uncharacterized membrane protein
VVERTRSTTFLVVTAVILLNVFGNLTLTWGLRHVPERLGLHPIDYIRAMLNPFVAAGIGLLILWLLTRMALMSWADLSFVLPVTAVGYVLNEFLARIVLHEQISAARWVGTLLIFGGALLVGTTTHRDTASAEVDPQ